MASTEYHFPIFCGRQFRASESDLLGLDWMNHDAEFVLPGDEGHLLRVWFPSQAIFRVLDEMPLSTEHVDVHGLVPENFAYRVEGSKFLGWQSAVWLELNSPISHYRFVTGFGCLDVLTSSSPEFLVVSADESLFSRALKRN